MPRKMSKGPKYDGILSMPVEKRTPPLLSLDTAEKIAEWRKREIERIQAELQRRHDALFAFYKIDKSSPQAASELLLAMCEAHVPGFQIVEDPLASLLDPTQGAGKVINLFPVRKNKRRPARWKEAFVYWISAYQAAADATGHKCSDEKACEWFAISFEDDSLKRPGSATRRKQRVRTLANILSAERRKLRGHKLGAPVS